LLQTLFFKFTGAEESIYIFSQLGVEPWGRIAAGCMELIAAVLLLIPATLVPGALLAIGIMAGAIASHFFKLGIVVQNDGGLLFVYGCIVLLCAAILLVLHQQQLAQFKQKLKLKKVL
jgi:DoxX-like family